MINKETDNCRILSILVILIVSSILHSCGLFDSNDKDDNEQSIVDDFPIDMIEDLQIVEFEVGSDHRGVVNSWIILLLDKKHEKVSLVINGKDVSLLKEGELDGKMEYTGSFDFLPKDELEYELSLDNNTFSGSLLVPNFLEIECPPEFDFESDFILNWTIDSDPDIFYSYIELYGSGISYFEDRLVSGDQRSDTFEKSIYESYSTNDLSVQIGAYPFNYIFTEDIIFITRSHVEFSECRY